MIELNGEQLAFKSFPNGETLVDGEQLQRLARSEPERNAMLFRYETDGDLIKLMFVKRWLDDRCGRGGANVSLAIAYMPYSRMDRVEGDSVFTLKYAAEFINALNFEQVTVIEPHSDVTPALLDRSSAIYPTGKLLERVVAETGFNPAEDYLFFPDAGAQKRYGHLLGQYRQLVGYKARDFRTGRIRKLDIVGDVDRQDFKVIIVDDLCSYGGTFQLSAERLRGIGAVEIHLLVCHCERSIFQGDIPRTPLIDRVFTTDTMLGADEAATLTDKIQIYPIGGMQP